MLDIDVLQNIMIGFLTVLFITAWVTSGRK